MAATRSVMMPVFNKAVPTHHANLMMQYMVGIKLRSMLSHVILSDFNMPDWGISHPHVDAQKYKRKCDLSSEHYIDFTRIQYLANAGAFDYFNWHGYGQRLDNFPQKEICRALFYQDDSIGAAYDADHIVCPVRGSEVMTGVHPGYTIVPVDFYEEVIREKQLRPVFMGQISDSIYVDELRRRFPEAIFRPSQGPIADFQTIRKARNIILSVSTFSWLAAWLSDADTIVMPLFGLFDKKAFPYHDLVPVSEPQYEFYDFPVQPAVELSRLMEAHRQISGQWKSVSADSLARF